MATAHELGEGAHLCPLIWKILVTNSGLERAPADAGDTSMASWVRLVLPLGRPAMFEGAHKPKALMQSPLRLALPVADLPQERTILPHIIPLPVACNGCVGVAGKAWPLRWPNSLSHREPVGAKKRYPVAFHMN